MYFFFCFPSWEGKANTSQHPQAGHPSPTPCDSGSSPAGAEAYCRGRQLAGTIEGSHRSSLTSSSWRMKPKLLGLHGHGSVAHTHTRREHSRAWGSSELPMFIQTHPCQVSRAPLPLPVSIWYSFDTSVSTDNHLHLYTGQQSLYIQAPDLLQNCSVSSDVNMSFIKPLES